MRSSPNVSVATSSTPWYESLQYHYSHITAMVWLAVVITISLVLQKIFIVSDFSQEYLAAKAWLDGISPYLLTADLAQRYDFDSRILLTIVCAHPPLAVLLSIPFSWLPWSLSQSLWFLLNTLAMAYMLFTLRPPTMYQWMLLFPAANALHFGTLEPLVLALMVCALRPRQRPIFAATALSLAVLLKVYPLLLLYGLWRQQKWQLLRWTVLILVILALILMVIDPSASFSWLTIQGTNSERFVLSTNNFSLSSILSRTLHINPFFSLIIVALSFLILSLWRNIPLSGYILAMMLISPVSWQYYLILLFLIPLPLFMQVLLLITANIEALSIYIFGEQVVLIQTFNAYLLSILLLLYLVWVTFHSSKQPPSHNTLADDTMTPAVSPK